MAKRAGLGRGLTALMEEMGSVAPVPARAGLATLPLAQLAPSPTQPRRHFDAEALAELAASIAAKGVLQPILVRPVGEDRYEIVAGERRWRASQQAGLHEVPVVIREMAEGEGFEAALIENVQRQDLGPVEEAQGYRRLLQDFGHTQETVAALTGKSRSHIANFVRVLDLPDLALGLLRDGAITLGHAKALLAADDPDDLATEVVRKGWSVRDTEKAARRRNAPATKPKTSVNQRDADLEALEAQIEEVLGMRVEISMEGHAGELRVRFSNLDQLDVLVARLQG